MHVDWLHASAWVSKVGFGAFCFGAVIGWITKEATVRTDSLSIRNLSGVIAAIGGAAVTLYKDPSLFADYCIGLAFVFFLVTLLYNIDPETGEVIFRYAARAAGSDVGRHE